MRTVGIIGAGIMAAGMARNFLKNGYEITVWNRSPERLEPLLAAGAKQAQTPRETTEISDLVIECVSDDAASRSVWLGDDGILAGATPDKVLITAATVSLAWVDELARLCEDHGLRFLDMPLTGSRAGAEGGTLKLLVGGHEDVLESVREDLGAISDYIIRFGEAGAGTRFKLMLNALSAIQIDAAAQAIEIARAEGVDPEAFERALRDGPMAPASGATMAFLRDRKGIDHVNFSVQWIEKDLRYAQEMARKAGKDFDLLDDAQRSFAKAKDRGLAEKDWSYISELYRK